MERTIQGIFSGNKGKMIRYFWLVSCAIILVFSMPKEIKFKFDFDKGRPWTHEDLSAPFDFAITKSSEEISLEKLQILNSTHPYYKFDETIESQQISFFNNEFSESVEKIPLKSEMDKNKLLDIGEKLLHQVFSKGILQKSNSNTDKNDNFIINVVRNNIATEYEIGELYNVKNAVYFIKNELKNQNVKDADFLIPLLENAITSNVFYDEEANQAVYKELIDNISPTRGMVQSGDIIIRKSEIISPEKYKILSSLKSEYEGNTDHSNATLVVYAGYLILSIVCLTVLMLFLFYFRKDIYTNHLKVVFLVFLVTSFVAFHSLVFKYSLFNLYLIPYCILPIIVRTFFDTRLALFTHLVMLLLIGFMSPNGFEFVFIQLIVGMVSVFSMVKLRNRSQLFYTSLLILATYIVLFLGISFIHEGSVKNIEWLELRYFMGNALLTLFVYPLVFVFERVFGFISDMTLLELSDSNSKLLRELSLKAPGTFQHSLQVANLAESAVHKIGGNSLLVRTGAMYHDIGKMDMPAFFIENLNSDINPHDDLSFEQSAKIIISHVEKGLEKARKERIPEQIIDFIVTHHGTTVVQYFYQSFLKNYPDQNVDVEQFKYPGPVPFSKEMAVLMMADSVEAASRNLKKADEKSIENVIDSIVENQIAQKQFINAPITFRDIDIIKNVFKKRLLSIYHARIEYPKV